MIWEIPIALHELIIERALGLSMVEKSRSGGLPRESLAKAASALAELSGIFTASRENIKHRYLDDPNSRAAYLLYFLPSNIPKIWYVLDELLAWAGAESVSRPTHRTLSPDEVVCLADGNLVEIGAHAVTHPVLSGMPAGLQRTEIRQSKTWLEEILGRGVSSFAYPFGTRSSYTQETVGMVREAGFMSACSNFRGLVQNGVNPYELPRYLVRNWPGEDFAHRLREWLSI